MSKLEKQMPRIPQLDRGWKRLKARMEKLRKEREEQKQKTVELKRDE